MKFDKFTYRIEPQITLSKKTLELLIDLSKAHYDGKCKAASEVGGFLYGWKNQLYNSETVTIFPTFRQIDHITKILEMLSFMKTSHLLKYEDGIEVNKFFNDLAVKCQEESMRLNNA